MDGGEQSKFYPITQGNHGDSPVNVCECSINILYIYIQIYVDRHTHIYIYILCLAIPGGRWLTWANNGSNPGKGIVIL